MITVYGIKQCDTCRKALKWLEAQGIDIKPCERYTVGTSTIGASGGGAIYFDKTPYDFPVNANDVFTSYYTPQDALAQVLTTLLHWWRPARSRSAVRAACPCRAAAPAPS